MIQSALLSELGWVTHGFGTRWDNLSQQGMASLTQIHSSQVLVADGTGCAGEGDALVTGRRGVPVSVRTADCYPILLVDPRNRVVAAVHAGWRGTAARVVLSALGKMQTQFGTNVDDVRAVIGPGIGPCCYHVGAGVARLFGLADAGQIDLAGANRSQLLQAGVPAASIEATGGCTQCDAEQFHSFRREKERAGRMISFIGVA